MNNLFLLILNMSLTGAFVIGVVFIARLLLRKAPKIFSYVLWTVVAFRLIFPFSIESALSLMPFDTAPINTPVSVSIHIDRLGIWAFTVDDTVIFNRLLPFMSAGVLDGLGVVGELEVAVVGNFTHLFSFNALDVLRGSVPASDTIRFFSGSINSGERNNRFVMNAGDRGVIVVFGDDGNLWYIPPHHEIVIRNAIPFVFEDWLLDVWGVTDVNSQTIHETLETAFTADDIESVNIILFQGAVDSAEALLERSFAIGNVPMFSIIMQYVNDEVVTEMFVRSVNAGNTAFIALTQDRAASALTIEEIDTFGFTAFEQGNTAVFSLLMQSMSRNAVAEIFTRAVDTNNSAFVALTQDRAAAALTREEADAMGIAAFERGDTSVFSLLIRSMSGVAVAEVFTRSANAGDVAFVALTQDRSVNVLRREEFDAMGIAAFERGDIGVFSLLIRSMSAMAIAEIFTRSANAGDVAFVAITQSRAAPFLTSEEIAEIRNVAIERGDFGILALIGNN